METLILPGFSIKNIEWAQEAKSQLSADGSVTIICWDHWNSGVAGQGWIEKELSKINRQIADRQVNILAKSIGTMVAAGVIKLSPKSINKLIMCGIPMRDLNPGDNKYYEVLKSFPSEKVLGIQNINDSHGSFDEAEKFIHGINPSLKIISKQRSDHEYPYFEEFRSFLKN